MSAPRLNLLRSSSAAPGAPTRAAAPRSSWLREPLLHFVVLGGLLFAVDRVVVARAGDPHTIVVGADVDNEAIETFKAIRGHEPNREELEALHHVWLDNEVLYREGLALQVDKGDTAIRERVIFKALSVIDSSVKLPPIDETALRKWFDGHREKYDEPARYDFEEAALSGKSSEAAVRAFVEELNGGTPGDAQAGLRVFKARPAATVVQSYGAEFAKTLAAAPVGKWVALQTHDGWRAIRLDAVIAPKPAAFESLRGVVLQDWTDATASEQRSAAVRALTKKYTVRYETPKAGGSE
jgi:PPIC-type PPIASE domain